MSGVRAVRTAVLERELLTVLLPGEPVLEPVGPVGRVGLVSGRVVPGVPEGVVR